MVERFPCFATCAPGIEPVLQAEAKALKLARVERQTGGVYFEGDARDLARANLELRTAVRVLRRLDRFHAEDADELYAGGRRVEWERFLAPDGTLAVTAQSSQVGLDHTAFVAQRVKDAIVDRLRERHGSRPDVDRDDPDLRVHAHLFGGRATLSLDSSGASLHKRGWRRHQGRAPLAETLAAAVLLLSGWNRRAPLLDPFCGSGTILVEAGLIASDTAPGLFRERFGFERWRDHDPRPIAELRAAARARVRVPRKLRLIGRDLDADQVAGARENAAAAGLGEVLEVEQGDALELELLPGWNAWIVTNAPYGRRVGGDDELVELHRRFGARLRESARGYHLALLAGSPRLGKALGLRPEERIALKNGGLDVELLRYEFPS
jgi:23S rRNA G2445 N2-methylase RlmL